MKEKILILDINEQISNQDMTQLNSKDISVIKRIGTDISNEYTFFLKKIFDILQRFLDVGMTDEKFFRLVILSNEKEETLKGLVSLLKTIKQEIDDFYFQFIQVDSIGDTFELLEKIKENSNKRNDIEIKYVEGKRYVKTMRKIDQKKEKNNFIWKESGTYIISGGAGDLGLLFASEIIKNTDFANIILVGRSDINEEKKRKINSLKNNKNHKVEYIKADVGSQIGTQVLVNNIMRKYKEISGIIHAAGIIKDKIFINKNQQEVTKVLNPKVQGAYYLDEATKSIDIDFIVLFSSGASELGNVGQSDYSSANAFLDQFAFYRKNLVQQGLRFGKTLSISWPLWNEGGMTVNEDIKTSMYSNIGMAPISNEEGIQAFYEAINENYSHIIVMNGDLSKFSTVVANGYPDNNGIEEVPSSPGDKVMVEKDVDNLVKKIISEVTQLDTEKIDVKESLNSYGVNSIQLNKINNKLMGLFTDISNTLIFQCESIEGLIKEIQNNSNELSPSFEDDSDKEIVSDRQKEKILNKGSNNDIAIVGMNGRFGNTDDIKGFEKTLNNKSGELLDIIKNRWDYSNFFKKYNDYEGLSQSESLKYTYNKWGYLIQNPFVFDATFFNMTPEEVSNIDPQERIFMEESWKAIADAGYTKKSLQSYRVGVFGAVTQTGFSEWGAEKRTSFSAMVNRFSNIMNFDGPSISIDTMCSSSLVAINQAIQTFRSNDIDMAIVGGVNLYMHPSNYINLCQKAMISKDDRNKVLSPYSNGYMPSEGAGALVLKKLDAAKEDNDNILAIIKSSKVKHSGKTAGYSIPSSRQQIEVIKSSLLDSKLSIEDLDHIELSANGNKIADDIEIESLSSILQKNSSISAGSLKSVIGNAEAVSGIEQVIKSVLEIQRQQIFPSNVDIDNELENRGIMINDSLVSKKDTINYIGINSFGAGGTYSHLILERFKEKEKIVETNKQSKVFLFSSKTQSSLKNLIKKWKDTIKNDKDLSIDKISNILITRREEFPVRFATVSDNREELIKNLADFIDDVRSKFNFYSEDSEEELELQGASKKAYSWTRGDGVNWGIEPIQNINLLPTYEFDKEHYPIQAESINIGAPKGPTVDVSDIFEKKDENISQSTKEITKYNDSKTFKNVYDIQRELKEILKNILDLSEDDRIATNESFYSLGIDSILVENFVEIINAVFNLNLKLTTIFNYSDVYQLSEYVYQNIVKED